MKQILAITTILLGLALAGQAQGQYPNGAYGQPQSWHTVLSPDDQKQFDKEYSKWADSTRKDDRDDIVEHARKMQDIMARYNIPQNVPFDQIATNGAPGYPAYPGAAPAYPNGNYGTYGATYQVRLSPDDQRKFDKDYDKWLESQRKNDRDDVDESARDMQQIMARYNLPVNTPFASIATNGYAVAGPNGAAPYPYAYGQGAQRLSSKDQEEFDKDFRHWVDSRRKRDMDDVDKNARKMQEIMARYNIPANVPFDHIATVGSAYH
jgi:hypothetical protein